eukprot:PhF_6_TR40908/c0_g1_i1/m.61884
MIPVVSAPKHVIRTHVYEHLRHEHLRTLDVIRDAVGQDPANAEHYLHLATRYALNTLERVDTAYELCSQWLKKAATPKAIHAAGQLHAILTQGAESEDKRVEDAATAVNFFHDALSKSMAVNSPSQYKIMYHMALHYAKLRDFTNAEMWVLKAIDSNRLYSMSWALLALIHSSCRAWKKCIQVLDSALSDFNNLAILLIIKARAMIASNIGNSTVGGGTVTPATILLNTALTELQSVDRYFQTLREGRGTAPSTASQRSYCVQGIPTPRRLLHWSCLLSESFILSGEVESALTASSLSEAQLHYVHHEVTARCEGTVCAVRAQALLHLGRADEAKTQLARSLVTCPGHPKVTLMLGIASQQSRGGDPMGAKHYLECGLRAVPTSVAGWRALAIVHKERNRLEMSADCLTTAMKLEFTSPVIPYDELDMNL